MARPTVRIGNYQRTQAVRVGDASLCAIGPRETVKPTRAIGVRPGLTMTPPLPGGPRNSVRLDLFDSDGHVDILGLVHDRSEHRHAIPKTKPPHSPHTGASASLPHMATNRTDVELDLGDAMRSTGGRDRGG